MSLSSPDDSSAVVHVAVGVIVNERDEVMISLRHPDSHQGGLWEFPGGKLEPGEEVQAGLRRELREELDLRVERAFPLKKIRFDYPDKSVLLDVWQVAEFSGEARGREGQPLQWRPLRELKAEHFPAANAAIVELLRLPREIVITPTVQSEAELLELLSALPTPDLPLVQLRQPQLDPDAYLRWFKSAMELCRAQRRELMFCQSPELMPAGPVRGWHANSRSLRALRRRPVGPERLFSASCHNLEELQHAEALGADLVYLSPVCPTSKYAPGEELGWSKFEQLAARVSLPVYALGGLQRTDLARARAHGAFGIAGISAFQAGA